MTAVGGGGDTQPQTDVVTRAKAAIREYGSAQPNIYTLERYRDLTVELCALVPELVAEVEKLRQMVGHCTGCGEICDGRCGQW